jgi:hypothetical protein
VTVVDLTSGGLLMAGLVVPVPNVKVIGPHDAAWAHLDAGDGRPRSSVPSQVLLHKTIADDPEVILPGAGPAGGAERTAEYWQRKLADGREEEYSGAQLVSGHDGIVGCLCDLVRFEAYHATVSNPYSIGIETCELPGGKVYDAALQATVATTLTIVEHLGIQLQIPARTYNGHPMKRMLDGGRDMIGVFGHRDNTERRGRWDPGERLFQMLAAHGAERFDFDAREDIQVWKARQATLVAKGYKLVVDGIPGPATTAALKSEGYRGGVYALGKG